MTGRNGFRFPDHDHECIKAVFAELFKIDETLKYVKDRSICVQAGGNVGVFPQYLARSFDHVITFEPDEQNFDCMAENVTEPNIEMHKMALGDNERLVGLNFVEGNCGAHSVHGEGSIPMVTIDSLGLESCGLIQLDIEGLEYPALGGGWETISKFKPVILVEDKGLSEKYGVRQGEIEYLLKPLGYEKIGRMRRDDLYCAGS